MEGEPQPESIRAQTDDPKDKTILIVELDKVLRETYEKMLKEQTFQVDSASSAEETLEKAKAKKFDLILLEFALPGKSGLEVLKELQKVEGPSTPIVVWTSKDVDEHMIFDIKREPSVREFIVKPIQSTVFINLLHKTLGTRPPAAPKTEESGGFGRTTGGFGRKGW